MFVSNKIQYCSHTKHITDYLLLLFVSFQTIVYKAFIQLYIWSIACPGSFPVLFYNGRKFGSLYSRIFD